MRSIIDLFINVTVIAKGAAKKAQRFPRHFNYYLQKYATKSHNYRAGIIITE